MKMRTAAVVVMLALPRAMAGTAADAFQRFDLDQDGFISVGEAIINRALIEQFNELDRNRDGQIAAEEFAMGRLQTDDPVQLSDETRATQAKESTRTVARLRP